ncbi:tryptophan 2,3-dioxygenase family protein [Streptomyces sp. R41]|uniref:Tryptophan 2,3-dioxygenase family protein n=1 Tax=Streptomyces sp. R41 TaxID=3238632 RepID=A0AB39RNF9_9ACTN
MTGPDYAGYLRLERLLSLQVPLRPADDDTATGSAELFFIVAHQTSELWLAQALRDLDAATEALTDGGRPGGADGIESALEYLARVAEVVRILEDTVRLLERLPVRRFAAFRPHLGTASGAQSQGFHALEVRLGTADDDESPLYRAFLKALAARGTSVEEVCALGAAGAGPSHRLAETLLDIGYRFWHWKLAHLALVDRTVGGLAGTGGTTGAAHLASRVRMPFPELRAVREGLHRQEEPHGRTKPAACPHAPS